MYKFLQHTHTGLAYLVLLALLVATIYFLLKRMHNAPLQAKDKKVALIAMALLHLQFLVGLIQYFMSPFFKAALDDFVAVLKNSDARLYFIEHPIVNLIAVILVTIGYSRIKRKINSGSKAGVEFALFGIGLLLILSRIPWSAWLS